jgi:hypothetical protein
MHHERVRSICALLEEEGVGSKVIEDFKRSLRESDLLEDKTRDKVRGAVSLKSADSMRAEPPVTPTKLSNASNSLSPIYLAQHAGSPSSTSGASSHARHVSRALQESRERFDTFPAAVDYGWIARQNMERKANIERLLRSPRPPTLDDMKRAEARSDSNFDDFSEHDPKAKGLKQLYIPPPSPKVPRPTASNALSSGSLDSVWSTLSNVASPSRASPSGGFIHRPVERSIGFLAESDRFDSFPDQQYRAAPAPPTTRISAGKARETL